MTETTRQAAQAIAEAGLVWQVGPRKWAVQAMTQFYGSYTVQDIGGRLVCECKGFHYRGYCKHIEAVRLVLGEEDSHVCQGCGAYLSHPRGLCSLCAAPKREAKGWAALRG